MHPGSVPSAASQSCRPCFLLPAGEVPCEKNNQGPLIQEDLTRGGTTKPVEHNCRARALELQPLSPRAAVTDILELQPLSPRPRLRCSGAATTGPTAAVTDALELQPLSPRAAITDALELQPLGPRAAATDALELQLLSPRPRLLMLWSCNY